MNFAFIRVEEIASVIAQHQPNARNTWSIALAGLPCLFDQRLPQRGFRSALGMQYQLVALAPIAHVR